MHLTYNLRAKAKKKKLDVKSIEMSAVCEMAVGGAREAAWDNVACRHLEGPIVTTWSTRKQSLGKHRVTFSELFTHFLSAFYVVI